MSNNNYNAIELIDATYDSLTVTWPAVPGTVRYVLEYKPNVKDANFEVLSASLTQTQARKKNIPWSNSGFWFRVGAISVQQQDQDKTTTTIRPKTWMTHKRPFSLLGVQFQMEAPTVTQAIGLNQTLLVSWKMRSMKGCWFYYELQMREFVGGAPWVTIANDLAATFAKKKNCTSTVGYQFRVRPTGGPENKGGKMRPFSPPSDPIVAKGLTSSMKEWFDTLESGMLVQSSIGSLMTGDEEKDNMATAAAATTSQKKENPIQSISLADALGAKEFVLFYAASRWSQRCKEFTPQLIRWYNSFLTTKVVDPTALGGSQPVEIVLLSMDEGQSGFEAHLNASPWCAIDYKEAIREQLLTETLSVESDDDIPRLMVVHGESGLIVVENFLEIQQTDDGVEENPKDDFKITILDKWRELAKEAIAAAAAAAEEAK